MAQLSRPLLVALAATVALVAIWLVALRPKPVPVRYTPLAPTQAIPKAKEATAISDAANAKVQAATGGGSAAPAAVTPPATTSSAAARAAASARAGRQDAVRSLGERRDAAVVRDLARGKIVVLLFWNPAAADDVATRSALRGLDLHGGKVVVRAVPIGRVAQYGAVTRGLKIAQSPTTVVIGRKRHTRVIVGLTEPRELAQAVGDALAGR
ncbi:MAG: hypothetical protein QOJ63_2740 [Solirubrobacteraceae bacterium]|jgi:hypothetical protein|nr:hypothetical protein [Solirubrobacteraceae bacterium]